MRHISLTIRRARHLWSAVSPLAALLIALPTVFLAGAQPAAAISPEQEKLFEEKVRPLLVARCQGCHGDRVAEGGLRLDNLPAVLKGGDSGTILTPGDQTASKVLKVVRRELEPAMPPDEPLPAEEVAILEAWIAAGVPWSGPGTEGPAAGQDAIPADMEARLIWARERHWAFQPLNRHPAPEAPAGLDPARSLEWGGLLDRFVTAKIVAAGLEPAACAGRANTSAHSARGSASWARAKSAWRCTRVAS